MPRPGCSSLSGAVAIHAAHEGTHQRFVGRSAAPYTCAPSNDCLGELRLKAIELPMEIHAPADAGCRAPSIIVRHGAQIAVLGDGKIAAYLGSCSRTRDRWRIRARPGLWRRRRGDMCRARGIPLDASDEPVTNERWRCRPARGRAIPGRRPARLDALSKPQHRVHCGRVQSVDRHQRDRQQRMFVARQQQADDNLGGAIVRLQASRRALATLKARSWKLLRRRRAPRGDGICGGWSSLRFSVHG